MNNARAEVATAYNVLHEMGLFDYAGDVSQRGSNGEYLIRRARASQTIVCEGDPTISVPEDILSDRIGLGGPRSEQLPIEYHIHAAVYEAMPEIGSVIHIHAPYVTALTIAGAPIKPVYIRGVETIGEELPVYPVSDIIVKDHDVAAVLDLLRTHGACALYAHGLVIAAPTLAAACVRAINVEHSAWMQLQASAIGTPLTLPPESIAARRQHSLKTHLTTNAWNYYVARYGRPRAGGASEEKR